ncbi:MAG: hypothetical protein ACXU86_14930, partial [Archangium sp.]
ALPGSGGFEDIPERRRERIEQGAPGAAPGEGAHVHEYLDVRRAAGSSEQWAGGRGPGGGASEPWTWSWGPGGSSEQWAGGRGPGGGASESWMRSQGPGGASEQWVWTWTRPSSSGQGR